MEVKKIANETTATTKAVRQNKHPYWKKEENVSYYVLVNSKPDHHPPPLSKFHRIQDVYMENMPKKTKLYSGFLLLRIYPDSPVHMSANMECIQICPVMM